MRGPWLWRRCRALIWRRRAERELREELDFHLAMQARKHQEQGIEAEEATWRARRELGNIELVKEDARDVRGVRPVEELVADLRYAIRGLRRAPVFAIAVVLTIGFGVGINTSVFTVFNAYVLRPFDVRDPYGLYSVQWMDRAGQVREFRASDVEAVRHPNPIVSHVVAYRTIGARLNALAATGDAVSGNFFTMAGVRPSLGRLLAVDDRFTASLVLSHTTWQVRFGGDSAIVGRRILLHGYPFLIVGVAQAGFEGFFKKPRDFWIPLEMLGALESTQANEPPGAKTFSLFARLGPGATASQGRAFVGSALQASTADLPDSSRFSRVFLTSRATALPRSVGSFLAFAPLAVAFALVLVLACANVANMLLARGLARQREVGTRLALGASRARLVRQLLTESVVLALPAVAVGFTISWLVVDVGVRALSATIPADLAAFVRFIPLQPDLRVLAFAFVAAVASAFLFGLVPSLQATRVSLVQATRGIIASQTAPSRFRNALIVGQVTIASLLLIVAGMLVREGARLGGTATGLSTHDVVSIEAPARARAAVLAALGRSGPVERVAAAATLPLDMRFPVVSVAPSGGSTRVEAMATRVSASYFDVLAIPIVHGRAFAPLDEGRGNPTVIVSEAAARRFWPHENPLGRTIDVEMPGVPTGADPFGVYRRARIVGVARDVVVGSVESGTDRPVLYFPAAVDAPGCCLLVRVHGDAAVAKRTLDAELERAVPGGVDRIDRLDTFVAGAVYPYRVAYWVALALGVLALGLTVIGVYGVVGYTVGQRRREIGIRIALGATARDVLGLVLRQSLRQALAGATIGTLLAAGIGRVLAANIERMPAFDIVAFASAICGVLAACLAAALVPSWRAARTEPTVALRHD